MNTKSELIKSIHEAADQMERYLDGSAVDQMNLQDTFDLEFLKKVDAALWRRLNKVIMIETTTSPDQKPNEEL